MTEQQAQQSGHETNSRDAQVDRLTASSQAGRNVDSPEIVPDQDEAAKPDDKALELEAGTAKAAMPKAGPFTVQNFNEDFNVQNAFKVEAVKVDAPRPDMPNGDAPQADGFKADSLENTPIPDTPKTDAASAGATRLPRELLIMSRGEHAWERGEDEAESGSPVPEPEIEGPGHGRRFAAMGAMLLLAVIAGAAGGALATVALSHPTETAVAAAPNLAALETSVGRIDADITALKAGLERNSTAGLASVNKTGDRLERIEKGQAEAAAKLAKLGDAVDKLRAAGSTSITPVAAATPKDVTGTVTTPAGAQALPAPQLHAPPATTAASNAPTSGVGRLPTVESWVLRDVSRGMALIEGHGGLYEVFAGDPVPGLGRVDAIRKQDGRWVVVTSKGLIVAR